MAKRSDAISPHHIGEVLVAQWMRAMTPEQLGNLVIFDPVRCNEMPLSVGFPELAQAAPHAAPGLAIQDSGGLTFDGMHTLDCALEDNAAVVGVELKLGTTRMRPSEFRQRFVTDEVGEANVPRLRGVRVDGSMVALLDWNQRQPPAGSEQPFVRLQAAEKPLAPRWLVVIAEKVLHTWKKNSGLNIVLGTAQLGGVIALEHIARCLGREDAKRLAKRIVCAAIDYWNL